MRMLVFRKHGIFRWFTRHFVRTKSIHAYISYHAIPYHMRFSYICKHFFASCLITICAHDDSTETTANHHIQTEQFVDDEFSISASMTIENEIPIVWGSNGFIFSSSLIKSNYLQGFCVCSKCLFMQSCNQLTCPWFDKVE